VEVGVEVVKEVTLDVAESAWASEIEVMGAKRRPQGFTSLILQRGDFRRDATRGKLLWSLPNKTEEKCRTLFRR
jgi:hypothetical protein